VISAVEAVAAATCGGGNGGVVASVVDDEGAAVAAAAAAAAACCASSMATMIGLLGVASLKFVNNAILTFILVLESLLTMVGDEDLTSPFSTSRLFINEHPNHVPPAVASLPAKIYR